MQSASKKQFYCMNLKRRPLIKSINGQSHEIFELPLALHSPSALCYLCTVYALCSTYNETFQIYFWKKSSLVSITKMYLKERRDVPDFLPVNPPFLSHIRTERSFEKRPDIWPKVQLFITYLSTGWKTLIL